MGVWLIWDPKLIAIDILEFGDQFIHARGRIGDGSCYFITAVYASPCATRRVLFWDVSKRLAVGLNAPWAVVGDFNSILSAEDKQGGAPFSRARNKSFIDTVDLCGRMDVPFLGPRFTWSRNNVAVRLDRALVNDLWLGNYPESSVVHLHKLKPALDGLSADLKIWNKKAFGNIFRRKLKLVEKLKQAELRVASLPSSSNLADESRIQAELELILWQEEAIWIQKSRSKWVVEGDKNTQFFHCSQEASG
ncbi:hypothetical protein LINPERHAP2_LOCUS4387 [Linum perenne]